MKTVMLYDYKVILGMICMHLLQIKGWVYEGHLVIAGAAKCILQDKNPEVIEETESILQRLHNDQTIHEKNQIFVESAIFADVIKRNGGQFQQTWHFNDINYNQPITFKYSFHQEIIYIYRNAKITVVDALKQCYDVLVCDRTFGCVPNNQIYNTVMQHYDNNHDIAISVILRLLIHYVGDINQPMHNINRNDRGGNEFAIKSHYGVNNLHALWDTSIYKYRNTTVTPFSDSDWITFYQSVCTLVNNFQFDYNEYQYTNRSAQQWSQESYDIGIQAYSGISFNQSVPLQYIIKYQALTQKRIALSAYRLAYILNNIYQ